MSSSGHCCTSANTWRSQYEDPPFPGRCTTSSIHSCMHYTCRLALLATAHRTSHTTLRIPLELSASTCRRLLPTTVTRQKQCLRVHTPLPTLLTWYAHTAPPTCAAASCLTLQCAIVGGGCYTQPYCSQYVGDSPAPQQLVCYDWDALNVVSAAHHPAPPTPITHSHSRHTRWSR